jgi:chitin disaccharide deacetylase
MPTVQPAAQRLVVLHADDFGMNRAVNAGILRGFTQGLLTSTSIMTNAPGWSEAVFEWKNLLFHQRHGALPSAALRRDLGDPSSPFDLGVHLNLTQGRPVTGERYPARLLDSGGRFPGIGALFGRLAFSGRRFADGIRRELSEQIERLLEQGIAPTHLNGHQYIELIPAVSEIVFELARRYSIPVVRVAWEPGLTRSTLQTRFDVLPWGLAQIKRMFACRFLIRARRAKLCFPQAYFGTAHAGRVDLNTLTHFLKAGRRYRSIEIGLHPGMAVEPEDGSAEAGWNDLLARQRSAECRVLTGTEIGGLLQTFGYRLCRLAGQTLRHQTVAAA